MVKTPELDELSLDLQIEEARQKLQTLTGNRFARMSKESPRISVGVTQDEYLEIQELARRSSTSASALGQLAFRHLLIQARAGALPMLPPSRLETAIAVDCLGKPLPVIPE